MKAITYNNNFKNIEELYTTEFFNDLTDHKAVIYGNKTLNFLPDKKPLKGRLNILYSRNRRRIKELYNEADYVFESAKLKDFEPFLHIPVTFEMKLIPKKIRSNEKLPGILDFKSLKISNGDTVLVIVDDICDAHIVANFFDYHGKNSEIYVLGNGFIHKKMKERCDKIYYIKSDDNIEGMIVYEFENLDYLKNNQLITDKYTIKESKKE